MTRSPQRPTGGAGATAIGLAVAVGLLVAGAGLYAVFVDHVLDRGAAIVKESVKSKAAREPLIMACAGIALLAVSGIVALASPLHRRRLGPLAGLGLPLSAGAIAGLGAFSLGRSALLLACVVAAPSLVTCIMACLTPPRPHPGLGRFLLRSWMATGFLTGLGLAAVGGLTLAEKALPRVPWSSLLAALAAVTLLQLAARYVGQHGGIPTAFATDHQQERTVQDTPAIRRVGERLHPFIEEGRGADSYAQLAAQLATATQQPAAAAPAPPPGTPALPATAAWSAAVLRAGAFAAPAAILLSGLAAPVAMVAMGLLLPFTRAALAPRGEPVPRIAWGLGTLLMAGGGWLAGQTVGPGTLLAPLGTLLGAPYAIALLASMRRRRLPGHLAHLRLQHARALHERWGRNAAGGVALAVSALLLPAGMWSVSAVLGIGLPGVSWRPLWAVAAGGLLWATAAALSGPAASRHRAGLDAQYARIVQERVLAHRTFLERLEMT